MRLAFVLKFSSGTHTCLITSLENALYLGVVLKPRLDMLCQEVTVLMEKPHGYSLPTDLTGAFRIVLVWETRTYRKPSEVDTSITTIINDRSIKESFLLLLALVKHLINRRLGADHQIPRL